MTVQAALDTHRDYANDIQAAAERRLYKRFGVKLVGRFMRADRHEFACQLRDISVGSMALTSPVKPDIDERIVVYMNELGGLEGTVVRHFPDGFAVRLLATQHKREKLAARITWLVNRHELKEHITRQHARQLPLRNTNTLKLSDDISLLVQILDVSLSGANIATEARPPLGSEVMLGKLRGEVVRHHDRGIGIRFVPQPEPDAVHKSFS